MLFPISSKREEERPPPPRTPRRRVIGLALGAGAARGWAHIGVIRELADHGIVPRVLAGTSIGAIVGAAHAAGKLDALEAFARSLNRRRVFTLMDLSFGGTSLINGARLKRRLDRDLAGLAIETLPLPFAAVAAEMTTGHEIWLTRGDVVSALRASYALPGIFEPVHLEGRWLFDGALVNPVPVSVCRALGADVVIAVNLIADIGNRLAPGAPATVARPNPAQASLAPPSARDTPAFDTPGFDDPAGGPAAEPRKVKTKRRRNFLRRRLFMRRENGAPGIASVMMDAFSISQDRISRSRLAIDPPEVMINARLTTCGLFDFHRAGDLIEHGRAAARRAIPDIEALLAGHARERL
jgi:NTE family protein